MNRRISRHPAVRWLNSQISPPTHNNSPHTAAHHPAASFLPPWSAPGSPGPTACRRRAPRWQRPQPPPAARAAGSGGLGAVLRLPRRPRFGCRWRGRFVDSSGACPRHAHAPLCHSTTPGHNERGAGTAGAAWIQLTWPAMCARSSSTCSRRLCTSAPCRRGRGGRQCISQHRAHVKEQPKRKACHGRGFTRMLSNRCRHVGLPACRA